MRIEINDKYTVTNNDMCYILTEKTISEGKKTKGQMVEKTIGYYSQLDNCFKAVVDRVIKKSDATSFKELVEIVNQVKADIDKCLKVLEY